MGTESKAPCFARRRPLTGIVAAALLAWSTNAFASGGVHQVESSHVFEVGLSLTAGVPVTIETRNTSPGADPYLRLFRESGSSLVEVARDDNGAGAPNARIKLTPAVSGYHTVLMHATDNSTKGKADVVLNGYALFPQEPVGGRFVTLSNLHAGEVITTLPLARGPYSHSVFVLSSTGQLLRVERSAASEATRHVVTTNAVSRRLLVSGVPVTGAPLTGPIRVVVNDGGLAGHDPDGDMLGTELEEAIGTCSTPTGIAGNFECNRATDARDTDGDGLSDSEELLGQIDRAPYLWLPRWGADPRHKDLFIEVDFNAQTADQPEYRMSAGTALAVAKLFSYQETDPLRRLLNAQSLVNPDALPGVRVHLDTGVDPPPGAPELDFTTYGNWGGHSYVPPDCSSGECKGAKAADVWPTYFHPSRVGLFHYALGYRGTGGSAPYHVFAANLPIGGPGIADVTAATAFSHEFGHTLGLGHSAPQGAEAPIDPNCKPNFPTLMNYGYLYQSYSDGRRFFEFSDGWGRPNLVNTQLPEQSAVPGPSSVESQLYLRQLRDFYGYHVDYEDGSVDWDRDGLWATKPVRAYSNDNGTCEWTRYNQMKLSGAQTSSSPALVRVGNVTAAFYIDSSKRLALGRTTSTFNCAVATHGCGTPLSHQSIPGAWNAGIDAFDVHRIVEGGTPRFLIVFRKDTRLYEVVLTTSYVAVGPPKVLPTITDAIDEVSLGGDDQHVYLLFKSYASLPLFMERADGVWNDEELIATTDGQYVTHIAEGSTPALLQETASDGTPTLHAVFPLASPVPAYDGVLTFYTFDFPTRRWRTSWEPVYEATLGRPAMAAVPMYVGAGFPTRLYLAWMRRDTAGRTVVRQTMLVGTPTGPAGSINTGFRMPADHDNSWFYGRGVDLLFEPGVDSNVRALLAPNTISDTGAIELVDLQLRPRADGISNYTFRNYDEWQYLGIDLCRTLDRFTCPPWPF